MVVFCPHTNFFNIYTENIKRNVKMMTTDISDPFIIGGNLISEFRYADNGSYLKQCIVMFYDNMYNVH